MIFNISITLRQKNGQQLMPFNYHYPLSAAIHDIISKSDTEFASFFHNIGYGHERYKLFTFSDILIPFTSRGDRMLLLGETGSFKVCFHVPAAAEHFIKGLFINEQLTIGDNISQVCFKIHEVEHSLSDLSTSDDDIISVVVQPISPLVVSIPRRDKTRPSQYVSPYEAVYADRLIFNWIKKYRAISPMTDFETKKLREQTKISVFFFTNPPVERRIIIKQGLADAQTVRGYYKFRMRLTAPKKMIDLALNSGMGVKNSMGMGCIQLINAK